MMINPKVKEAVEWYSKNRALYQALAKRVESIVRQILEFQKINYHSITSRAKTMDSYKRKASSEKYQEPLSEIKDMTGIRVITYTDSDAKKVAEIANEVFDIYPEHTIDKTEELGIDRVGYRSIHCVGTLGKERLKLPENKIFKDMCFEIQIRTMLQHAWAEFEHDRNYKFAGVLPKEVRRRLSILAGNLELIDREFDNISKDIDAYAINVGKKAELGDLSEPINSTSLMAYMNRRFKPLIEKGVTPDLVDDAVIIEELHGMGINTLEELEKVIPKDFMEKKSKYISEGATFMGLLRSILMIHDIDTYFQKAWKETWGSIHPETVLFLKEYEIDFKEYSKRYDVKMLPS